MHVVGSEQSTQVLNQTAANLGTPRIRLRCLGGGGGENRTGAVTTTTASIETDEAATKLQIQSGEVSSFVRFQRLKQSNIGKNILAEVQTI